MGVVVLPRSLTELFPAREGRPALPRRVAFYGFGAGGAEAGPDGAAVGSGGEAAGPHGPDAEGVDGRLVPGTVGDLIEFLDRTWPGLLDRLCEPGPVLRAYINVYVDGEPAAIDTPVPLEATVHVLPAVAGGDR
jgi:molybdopterin converting factor small subunit